MKTWVRKTLSVGVLAASALLFAPGAAQAVDVDQASVSSGGLLNGTQLAAPINIPVNVSGVGLGVLGEGVGLGGGSSAANARMRENGKVSQASANSFGLLNGTQAYVPVNVPINICGIGVGVLGGGAGGCAAGGGGQGNSDGYGDDGDDAENGSVNQASANQGGLLNGTQAFVPVNIPVNIGGIGAGVLGTGVGQAGSFGTRGTRAKSHNRENVSQASVNQGGLLNGTAAYAPISIPVNLSGIGLGVLGTGVGQGMSQHAGGSSKSSSHRINQASANSGGLLNGTALAVPVDVPINVCGIGAGVLGGGAGSCGGSGNGQGSGNWHGNGNGNGNGHGNGNGNHGNGNGNNAGSDDDGYGQGANNNTSDTNSNGGRRARGEASPLDSVTGVLPAGGATSGLLGGLPLSNLG